jgi:hypothetical protein
MHCLCDHFCIAHSNDVHIVFTNSCSVRDLEEVSDVDGDALTDADVRDAIELAHESALTILESRRFSEVVENPKSLRFQATTAGTTKNEGATIVMKSLGDWNRYGIQPLRLAYQEDTVEMNSVGFYTLKGGHFDGEIRFSVECTNHVENDETKENSGDMSSHNGGLVVSVSLVIAKKGRKVSAFTLYTSSLHVLLIGECIVHFLTSSSFPSIHFAGFV